MAVIPITMMATKMTSVGEVDYHHENGSGEIGGRHWWASCYCYTISVLPPNQVVNNRSFNFFGASERLRAPSFLIYSQRYSVQPS